MKKLLLVLTAVAVSLAFAGMVFAGGLIACPGPCETVLVPKAMGGKAPDGSVKINVPKFGKIAGPKTTVDKCGNCITIPGDSYAMYPYEVPTKKTIKVDVMKDLCKGACKGKTPLCGTCLFVTWDCKWKTSVICGKTEIEVDGPKKPAARPFPVVCKPKPCPPPDCY